MRKYQHLVVRFRKKESSLFRILEIVVILNRKKSSSRVFKDKIGFLHVNATMNSLYLNTERLGYYLNRGAILNKKVKAAIGRFCCINTKKVV
jgi:ribosomal protein S16